MDAEHTEILARIAIPLRELVNHLQGAVDSARQVSQSVDDALKAPDVKPTPWTVKFRHASRGVNIAEAKMAKPHTPGMQLEIHDEASGLDLMYEVTEVKSEPHRLKVRCMVRGPITLPPEAVPPDPVGTLGLVAEITAGKLPEAAPQDTSHPADSGSPLDESVERAKAAVRPLVDLYFCRNTACPGHVYASLDCSGKGYICSQGCAPGHRMGEESCYGVKWWRKSELAPKPPEGPLDAPHVPEAVKPMTDEEMGEIGQFNSSDQSHE